MDVPSFIIFSKSDKAKYSLALNKIHTIYNYCK